MASPSKETQILRLIFESSPLKHWHFEDFVKQSDMTRATINKWIKRYQKEGLIKKIKERKRFPYYSAESNNHIYQAKKKQFMLNQLYSSGLISYLLSLENVKTIIIFGSIARGDWYKDSDIDIFIFGKPKQIEKYKYELELRRNIEFHIFESKDELKEIKTGLIKNISDGYLIKGRIQDFAEVS